MRWSLEQLKKKFGQWEQFTDCANCLSDTIVRQNPWEFYLEFLSGRIQHKLLTWKQTLKKKKSPKLKPVRRLPLSSIYDGRFDSSELPPWTAALIVLECGLMDVGLEIKEIHPLRFCLIFKRHLTFLSGVSSLSWMSAREDGPAVVTVGCTRGQAGLKARARVNFRIESSLCFNNRKSTPKLSGVHTHTHTQMVSPGRNLLPFFSFR